MNQREKELYKMAHDSHDKDKSPHADYKYMLMVAIKNLSDSVCEALYFRLQDEIGLDTSIMSLSLETDPRFEKILELAEEEASQNLKGKEHPLRGHRGPQFEDEKARILKDKYGIDWIPMYRRMVGII